ncbi:2OG-Fe(II) oxygenase family protein [Skeletonema marinoi]|uniref:2OG-Fe(II) oxygenase family protein n=1 Tax=Skeletonema marinoi TaxID=267567 RepID=A0AAD8YDB0_9STRA|nr:2OG-Fe(II) oxygenase family protein [Skeletonema marinoi]
MMSKRQRTNSSSGARQQTTLLGLWKKPEEDKQSADDNLSSGRKRERDDDSDLSTPRPASKNNTVTSLLTGSKQQQWENISLHSNAPMMILRGGIGGKKKTSMRKSLVALPDWNENVTFHAFGRECTMRRRICQYSLQGKFSYSYSGLKNVQAPAFPSNLYEINNLETIEMDLSLSSEFIELVKQSAARSKQDEQRLDIFNYCLLNHYRNGQEYMSYHSDDEASLCQYSPIASISFGVTRSFDIRQKMTKGNKNETRSRIARIPLGDGDILLMFPPMQQYYEHALPVEKRVVGERINLTFRRLV